MTIETELYKNLREERLGGPTVAAKRTHAVLVDEGYEPLPDWHSVLKMIMRAEQEGAPKRSTIWPYYQRLLGIEEQRPAIEAAMTALSEVDERLAELSDILAGMVGTIEEQTKAIREAHVARIDDTQLNEVIRKIIEAVTGSGPFGPDRFFQRSKKRDEEQCVGIEAV